MINKINYSVPARVGKAICRGAVRRRRPVNADHGVDTDPRALRTHSYRLRLKNQHSNLFILGSSSSTCSGTPRGLRAPAPPSAIHRTHSAARSLFIGKLRPPNSAAHQIYGKLTKPNCCARGRPIIVEWETPAFGGPLSFGDSSLRYRALHFQSDSQPQPNLRRCRQKYFSQQTEPAKEGSVTDGLLTVGARDPARPAVSCLPARAACAAIRDRALVNVSPPRDLTPAPRPAPGPCLRICSAPDRERRDSGLTERRDPTEQP
ncbi:hypothetical protein EVAR_29207_1 [Eumeta japonica]|uniref:Uncharacterized protein n=1 Tax=Eumeta variegata TaxID=151549 RepID=A0A4C1VK68_EUMVA|nr:hypothetical protein EVAR_29207_1 [Eumeta japonica]